MLVAPFRPSLARTRPKSARSYPIWPDFEQLCGISTVVLPKFRCEGASTSSTSRCQRRVSLRNEGHDTSRTACRLAPNLGEFPLVSPKIGPRPARPWPMGRTRSAPGRIPPNLRVCLGGRSLKDAESGGRRGPAGPSVTFWPEQRRSGRGFGRCSVFPAPMLAEEPMFEDPTRAGWAPWHLSALRCVPNVRVAMWLDANLHAVDRLFLGRQGISGFL